MGTDVNWTYCADHFNMYSNIESLSCTPETNIMLYVNFTSIKKTHRQNDLNIVNEFSESLKLPHSYMGVTGSREDEGRWKKVVQNSIQIKII